MKANRVQYFAENMDRLSRRDRVFLNNPVIVQGLGLAPIVIAANTVNNAIILAFATTLLLTPTRMIATAIGQRLGLLMRAVTYVLTSSIIYIAVAFLCDYIFGSGTLSVGIYLPLLVMEPLVLKRYESPKRERVSTSFKKGIITTIGFCLVMFIMAGLREILSLGTFAGYLVLRGEAVLPFASMPAGGFILLGLLAAIWRGLVGAFKKNVSMGVKQLP